MRSTLKTMAFAGVLAIGGLAMIHLPAHAGCGGDRGTGGYGGGHSFNSGYYSGRGGGSRGGGCGMPGMNMEGDASTPGYSPVAYPQAAPQPAAACAYTCPMHPTVASATPGSCTDCHMALPRR